MMKRSALSPGRVGSVFPGPLGVNNSWDGEVMITPANTNTGQSHSPWKLNTAVTAKQLFVEHLTLPWQFTASSEGVIVSSRVLYIKQKAVRLIPAAACGQVAANEVFF